MFPRMKRRLKRLFNLLYRANDFSYNPFADIANDEEVRGLADQGNADTWDRGLSPRVRNQLIFEDPTCAVTEPDEPLEEE